MKIEPDSICDCQHAKNSEDCSCSQKKLDWKGSIIKVGDTIIGKVENWSVVDKKDLPDVAELTPMEYIPSQQYSIEVVRSVAGFDDILGALKNDRNP